MTSDYELVSNAIASTLSQMRKDVAPFTVDLKLKAIESDKSNMSDTAKITLKNALKFAEHDMWDSACEKFMQAGAEYGSSPAIFYNIGLCSEINGDSETAKGYYGKALTFSNDLSSSDEKLVFLAIKRIDGKGLEEHNKEAADGGVFGNAMQGLQNLGSNFN